MHQNLNIFQTENMTALNRVSVVSDISLGLGTLGLMRLFFKAYSDSIDNGITGLFICDGKKLGQVLEGDARSIQLCWDTIARDGLHENVLIYENQPISVRQYDNWSMHIKDGFILTLMYPQCRQAVTEINSDSTEEVLGIMHSYAALVKSV
jgi:hypothetical protein